MKYVTTFKDIGLALINVSVKGYSKNIIGVKDTSIQAHKL